MLSQALGRLRDHEEQLLLQLPALVLCMLLRRLVDPTAVVDPFGGADDANPIVAPHLSFHAMMESFMTTQAAHGQLHDELLTEVASLRADFMEYRSAFPPSPPFED